MKKFFTILAAGLLAVSVNAQSVDYEMMGFIDNNQDQNFITELALGLTDDLNPNAVLKNNGPDVPAGTDSIFLDISVSGQALGSMYLLGSDLAGLTAGNMTSLAGQQALMTAADMDQYGIQGTFELCYAVRIVSATTTDPVSTNNQACLTVTRGVGINDFSADEVAVYPNPATTVINVANAENAQISVFDMTGKVIANVENASANQTIDVSNFAKGLYFVRIVNGNNTITKKISVVK